MELNLCSIWSFSKIILIEIFIEILLLKFFIEILLLTWELWVRIIMSLVPSFFVIFYARDSRRYSNNCIIAFFLLRRIKKNVFLMSRKRRSRKRRRSWTCIHRLLWFILIILFLFSCKHGDVANWAPHLSIHHASTTTTMYQWTLWTMIFVDVKHYQTKMYMLPGRLVKTQWKVKS